jgi:hypothetical protein
VALFLDQRRDDSNGGGLSSIILLPQTNGMLSSPTGAAHGKAPLERIPKQCHGDSEQWTTTAVSLKVGASRKKKRWIDEQRSMSR